MLSLDCSNSNTIKCKQSCKKGLPLYLPSHNSSTSPIWLLSMGNFPFNLPSYGFLIHDDHNNHFLTLGLSTSTVASLTYIWHSSLLEHMQFAYQ